MQRDAVSTLDIDQLNDALQGTVFHGKLHHFAVIESTNARALADAQAGAKAGQVYIADEQTAGRGRGGHTWHSEPGRGLYLTALVRPPLHGSDILKLSLAAGIAAYEAIFDVTGLHIDLRWPNDLVSPPSLGPVRKLGGILSEAALTPDGSVQHAAIGIGINLNQQAFPPDLQVVATSLCLMTGAAVSRERIAVAFLTRLDAGLSQLAAEQLSGSILERFVQISSWVVGKHVQVDEDGGYTGVTGGLTREGLLRVQCADGCERVVRHGGVRGAA